MAERLHLGRLDDVVMAQRDQCDQSQQPDRKAQRGDQHFQQANAAAGSEG